MRHKYSNRESELKKKKKNSDEEREQNERSLTKGEITVTRWWKEEISTKIQIILKLRGETGVSSDLSIWVAMRQANWALARINLWGFLARVRGLTINPFSPSAKNFYSQFHARPIVPLNFKGTALEYGRKWRAEGRERGSLGSFWLMPPLFICHILYPF